MKKKIVCIYLCMLLIVPIISTTVIANSPPTAPDIDGPTSGKAGEPQTYTFTSTDPEGDDISYNIQWGCGESESTDFYPSGDSATATHTFGAGNYVISVTAMDIHQAESDPSTLEISMPRSKAVLHMFYLRLLQRFSYAFPIIRQLLGQ